YAYNLHNLACAVDYVVTLVTIYPLRHVPWADDFPDPVRHAPFPDRFRLPRPQAIDSDGGRRNPLPGARATLRVRVLSGNDGGPPIARHQGEHLDHAGGSGRPNSLRKGLQACGL